MTAYTRNCVGMVHKSARLVALDTFSGIRAWDALRNLWRLTPPFRIETLLRPGYFSRSRKKLVRMSVLICADCESEIDNAGKKI